MYTLLGASVLGFDLVRRPGGGAVASLLVEAMALEVTGLNRPVEVTVPVPPGGRR